MAYRNYNKPFFLDVNIITNILGFDDEETDKKISAKYEKNKLTKYIKNHGLKLTVFNLYEILKNKKFSNQDFSNAVKNLKLDVFTPYEKNQDIFTDNYKEEFKDEEKVNKFLKKMKSLISEHVAGYYTDILIFPLLYLLNILHARFKEPEKYLESLNEKRMQIDKIKEIVLNSLKCELLKIDIGIKDKIFKIINNHYKNIFIFSKMFFDGLASGFEIGNLVNKVNELIQNIEKSDLNRDVQDADGSKKVGVKHNFFHYVMLKIFEEKGIEIDKNKDELKAQIIYIIKEYMELFYTSAEKRDVLDKYFEVNMIEFYLEMFDKENKDKKSQKDLTFLKTLIDTNDIVDKLSLDTAYETGCIYLTVDYKLNKVIRQVYDKKRIKIIDDFIKINN